MNDELTKCYDLLGMSRGASPEELKVAYRDLAKVWHPDRFLHDPRLQEKAQEKLKEINEAYDQLRSGRAKRQTPAHAQTRNVAVVQRIRWQLILAPVLIFAVVFLVTYRSLLRPSERQDQSSLPAMEQPQAPPNPERQQPGSRDTVANELINGTDRIKAKSQTEESDSASSNLEIAARLPPLPTVTVVIDPYTGMIARPDCPLKSRMSYPSGNEPHQQCNALHPVKKTAPADASGPKDSRIKSVAKRLVFPW